MPKWTDEYIQMVEDCMNRESRMTEWECGFVESIDRWLADEKPLTLKQTETLEKIWERVTARG